MIDFLRRLDTLGKVYYTIADLLKITGFSRDTLYVTLSRCVKKKALVRLSSGLYILPDRFNQIEMIANALYQPSYLSFESALARHGILSQIPYTLSFATRRKSLRKIIGGTRVEYRLLKPALFFGFEKVGSVFAATPEKALLDILYFISFGKSAAVGLGDLNLKGLDIARLRRMAEKFPARTRRLTEEILSGGSKKTPRR